MFLLASLGLMLIDHTTGWLLAESWPHGQPGAHAYQRLNNLLNKNWEMNLFNKFAIYWPFRAQALRRWSVIKEVVNSIKFGNCPQYPSLDRETVAWTHFPHDSF